MSVRKFDRNTTALQVLEKVDLTGKTILITGANNGIGFETAKALAYHNAHVIMACRNLQAAEKAKQSIKDGYSDAKIDVIYLDCSKLKSVETCANDYIAKGWPLNILILNAGVLNPPEKFTEDGFESTFQINHLAHFYLVQLLEPVIVKNAPVRIVQVASAAHRQGKLDPGNITWNFLSPTNPREMANPQTLYARSKFCNILFSNELQKRWQNKGITSNCLHPGAVMTQIQRNTGLARLVFMLPTLGFERLVSVEQAAATSVFCATSPELEGIGGKYLEPVKITDPDRKATNKTSATNLWVLSNEMIQKWKQNEPVKN